MCLWIRTSCCHFNLCIAYTIWCGLEFHINSLGMGHCRGLLRRYHRYGCRSKMFQFGISLQIFFYFVHVFSFIIMTTTILFCWPPHLPKRLFWILSVLCCMLFFFFFFGKATQRHAVFAQIRSVRLSFVCKMRVTGKQTIPMQYKRKRQQISSYNGPQPCLYRMWMSLYI